MIIFFSFKRSGFVVTVLLITFLKVKEVKKVKKKSKEAKKTETSCLMFLEL